MASNRKSKDVSLPFSASIIAMMAMFATNQAHVTRVPHEGGIDLVFNFAAQQQFTLTWQGERLIAATLTLVEGREPSTQAMVIVGNETTINTIDLFEELESNDILRAAVVTDDGFSLHKDGVEVGLAEVAAVNPILAAVFKQVLASTVGMNVNVGDSLESLRAELIEKLRQPKAA